MKFSVAFRRDFEPHIRERGEEYFYSKAVIYKGLKDSAHTFSIQGSRQYEAQVFQTPHNSHPLEANCSCPYFQTLGNCKHLWACLLTLDQILGEDFPNSPLTHAAPKAKAAKWVNQIEKVIGKGPAKYKDKILTKSEGPKYSTLEYAISIYPEEDEFIVSANIPKGKGTKEVPNSYLEPTWTSFEDSSDLSTYLLLKSLNSKNSIYDTYYYQRPKSRHCVYEAIFPLKNLDEILQIFSKTGKTLFNASGEPFLLEPLYAKIRFSTKTDPSGWMELEAELGTVNENQDFQSLGKVIISSSGIVITANGKVLSISNLPEIEREWALYERINNGSTKIKVPLSESSKLETYFAQILPKTKLENLPDLTGFQTKQASPQLILQLFVRHESHRYKYRSYQSYINHNFKLLAENGTWNFYETMPKEKWDFLKKVKYEYDLSQIPALKEKTAQLEKQIPRGAVETEDLKQILHDLVIQARAQNIVLQVNGKRTHEAKLGNFDFVSRNMDWFELSGKALSPSGQIELSDILSSYRDEDLWVSLPNGDNVFIDAELEKFVKTMRLFANAKDKNLNSPLSLNYRQKLFVESFMSPNKDYISLLKNANTQTKDPSPPLKKRTQLKATLRDYQNTGVSWMHNLSQMGLGGILADDMGLGKTLQCLGYLEHCYSLEKTIRPQTHQGSSELPTLILVPKSLLDNWNAERLKFLPQLKMHVHTRANRKQLKAALQTSHCVVANYHLFREDFEQFKSQKYKNVLLDEAQYLKNSDTQIYQAVAALDRVNTFAITGTPLENSIKDLLSMLSLVNPGMLPESFCQNLIECEKNLAQNEKLFGRFKKALAPLMLRRKKKDVLLELPEKTESIVYCELNEKHRLVYDSFLQKLKLELQAKMLEVGKGRSHIVVLEALLRLRQICNHPTLVNDKYHTIESIKVEAILEKIQTLMDEGQKVLLFSQFVKFLEIIEAELKSKKVKYSMLTGKTNHRGPLIKAFEESNEAEVLLLSLKAGGVGLNLASASYVIIADPWWNPAVENQAIDRAHRFGQKNKVNAYRFVAKDTVEEKVLKLQEKKRVLFENLVEGTSALASKSTIDDLLDVLS